MVAFTGIDEEAASDVLPRYFRDDRVSARRDGGGRELERGCASVVEFDRCKESGAGIEANRSRGSRSGGCSDFRIENGVLIIGERWRERW